MTGGCACGAIRYRLGSTPYDAGYCHCRVCQLSSGAPALAFGTVPLEDFVVTAGALRRRRSTSFGQRGFCPDCGTQLTMQVDHQPETIDLTLASLDEPDRVAPAFHIWTASRISWFETADTGPRFTAFRPQTRLL